MRIPLLLPALLALASACAGSPPAEPAGAPAPAPGASAGAGVAPAIAGRWRLVRIDGQAVPAPSPGNRNVVIDRGTVEFGADGRFTIEMRRQTSQGGSTALPVGRGTYRLEGDQLHLTPSGGVLIRQRFTVEGRTLRIVDATGGEWSYVRQ